MCDICGKCFIISVSLGLSLFNLLQHDLFYVQQRKINIKKRLELGWKSIEGEIMAAKIRYFGKNKINGRV